MGKDLSVLSGLNRIKKFTAENAEDMNICIGGLETGALQTHTSNVDLCGIGLYQNALDEEEGEGGQGAMNFIRANAV